MIKEFLEQIEGREDRDKFLSIWKKTKMWGKICLASAALGYALVTSPFTVSQDSVAVVQRFGAFNRQEGPGLHFKIPGAEEKTIVQITLPQTEEFGYRTIGKNILGPEDIEKGGKLSNGDLEEIVNHSGKEITGNLPAYAGQILRSEYTMLTGDLNLADVEWIVQWNIKDAKDYVFNVRSPITTLRDCSLSVNKQLIGNRSVDETITIGREEYEGQHKVDLQELLDECGTGVNVITPKLQSTHAPHPVRASFNAVSTALQQKETRINAAMKNYNEVVPLAEGRAKKLIEDARGYSSERINAAKGDILKFSRTYDAYLTAPDITRKRMYFEGMQKFLSGVSDLKIVEQKGADGGILLKYDINNSGGSK